MVSESEKSFPVAVGNSFDVVSLLCGGNGSMNYLYQMNGDLVEVDENTFRDKYIMVCCFHVPVVHLGSVFFYLQELVNTCFELFSARDDIEIVVVAKMNKLGDYELVFNHFFSGFPSSCLLVPFKDSIHRDYICCYLDLCDRGYIRCLILDKGNDKDVGKNMRNILLCGNPNIAMNYGADAFPFTTEKTREIGEKNSPKWTSPSASSHLEGLLECNPSDVLKNINPAGGGDGGCEEITVSKLKEKVVGLYLCIEGNLLPTLMDTFQQCRAKKLSFEVVLVYLPFGGWPILDPEDYILRIDRLLQQHDNPPWWRLPFKNSVSHKFRRLSHPLRDELIIVGDPDKFIEPYGGEVMRSFGVAAYSFTREDVVQQELSKVKEVTLESLLVYESRNYVLQLDKKIAVSELVGRNIILYFCSLSNQYYREDYYKVLTWYNEIQVNDPTFEVVFVLRHCQLTGVMEDYSDLIPTMPWLVCPFDRAHSDKISTECSWLRYSLVEFGKDGRVRSIGVASLLDYYGPKGFPFGVDESRLRKDVIDHLKNYYEFILRTIMNFLLIRSIDPSFGEEIAVISHLAL